MDIDYIVKGGKVYTQEEILCSIPSEEEVMKSVQAFIKEWEETSLN